jgi:hypothetical protein
VSVTVLDARDFLPIGTSPISTLLTYSQLAGSGKSKSGGGGKSCVLAGSVGHVK